MAQPICHSAQTELQNRGKKMLKNEACKECGACRAVCPAGAIDFQSGDGVFMRTVIDKDKCISCGLCEKVCEKTSDVFNEAPKAVFMGRNNERRILDTSRSGGVFRTVAQHYVSAYNAVVYGAVMDGLEPGFLRTEKEEELQRFSNSKYVWCDHTKCFDSVIGDLEAGRIVLWSGLPCQTAALKAVLDVKRTDTANLYTFDLSCHGCPPRELFFDYIKDREKRLGEKVEAVDFRNKQKYGWALHIETLYTATRSVDLNNWTRLFYSHLPFRNSCFSCEYKAERRVSDMTLADCLNVEKTDSKFNDNRGCSLLLVNTGKGMKMLEAVMETLDMEKTDLKHFNQDSFKRPYEKPEAYEAFWKAEREKGFDSAVKEFVGYGRKEEFIFWLKRPYYRRQKK